MILLVDNYDSFSYNLYQLIGSINPDITVIRNDEMTVREVEALNPEYIILSPGPKRPIDAGICIELAATQGINNRVLGVCLGHQSICEAYGATVTYAKQLMHGKQSICEVDNSDDLFRNLGDKITVARYHSLACDEATLPDCLKVTARTDDGEIMAVKHKERNIWGVQFHPESIMTPDGMQILKNFLGVNDND